MDMISKAVLAVYAVGVALIVAGQSFYAYVNTTIADLGTKLSQPGLSQSEHYALAGSLNWWQAEKTSTYGPIALYTLFAGILVLVVLTAYAGVWVMRSHRGSRVDS